LQIRAGINIRRGYNDQAFEDLVKAKELLPQSDYLALVRMYKKEADLYASDHQYDDANAIIEKAIRLSDTFGFKHQAHLLNKQSFELRKMKNLL
jgi:tetratricopeptide (TPR) repeat protein